MLLLKLIKTRLILPYTFDAAECAEYQNLYRDETRDRIFGDVSYGSIGCVKFTSGGTIIGGERAQPNQYPAMVIFP